MLLKIQKSDIKISGFVKTSKIQKKKLVLKKKEKKYFCAYGHVSQS